MWAGSSECMGLHTVWFKLALVMYVGLPAEADEWVACDQFWFASRCFACYLLPFNL